MGEKIHSLVEFPFQRSKLGCECHFILTLQRHWTSFHFWKQGIVYVNLYLLNYDYSVLISKWPNCAFVCKTKLNGVSFPWIIYVNINKVVFFALSLSISVSLKKSNIYMKPGVQIKTKHSYIVIIHVTNQKWLLNVACHHYQYHHHFLNPPFKIIHVSTTWVNLSHTVFYLKIIFFNVLIIYYLWHCFFIT